MDQVMADGPLGAYPIAMVHHAVSTSHTKPSGVRHATPNTLLIKRWRMGAGT
jgi:hypothetical protein